MVDTMRSLPELQTFFADNVTGKIRARYSRDLAVTVFGYRATVNPTVNNDSVDTAALGVKFSIGSTWVNTNAQVWFVCVDDRPTIALWLPLQAGVTPYLTLTAASNLSGHRIVTTDGLGRAIYADNSTLSNAGRLAGLTTGAVMAGNPATIQYDGRLVEPSWAWTPGDLLFLGATGVMVNVAPGTGFVQQIGYADTTTSIIIDLGQSMVLV